MAISLSSLTLGGPTSSSKTMYYVKCTMEKCKKGKQFTMLEKNMPCPFLHQKKMPHKYEFFDAMVPISLKIL